MYLSFDSGFSFTVTESQLHSATQKWNELLWSLIQNFAVPEPHTHKLVFRPVSVNSTFCLCSMCAPTYGLWIKLRVCVRWCTYSCTSARASKRSTFSHTASITPVGFSCLRDGARGAFFSFHSPGLPLFCPVLSSIGLWLSAKKPGDVCCPPLPSKRPKSLFSEFLRVLRCLAQFCKTRIVQ